MTEEQRRLIDRCDHETRLAIAAHIFEELVKHAKDPGSFRYLIYARLGFTSSDYETLYNAGGMVISNEFRLTSS